MAAKIRCFGISIVILAAVISYSDAQCQIPKQYWGDFFSIEQGDERDTLINGNQLSNDKFQGTCRDIRIDNSTRDAAGNYDSKLLLFSQVSGCYECWDIYFRTLNVLQFKKCRQLLQHIHNFYDVFSMVPVGQIPPPSLL